MKKISALLSFLILFTAFTCEDEPLEGDFVIGDTDNPNSSLIGDWYLVSFDVSMNTVTNATGSQIETDILVDSFNPDYNLNFTSTAFTTNGSYSYNTEVTVQGQTTTDSYTIEDVNGSGTYSTNGNTMTLDGSFFEFTFQGVDQSVFEGEQTAEFEITNNGQTLTFNQNTTETDNSSGFEVTVTTVGTSVWTRVEESNNNNDCEAATTAAQSAETAYNADNTNEDLCNAYKTALQNQITACGDDGTLQTIIDGLGDCINNNNGQGSITVTAGTLPLVFDEISVVVEGGIVKVSGETSAQNDYSIYFEVAEGATGEDAMQNFEISLTSVFYPSTLDPPFHFISNIDTNTTGSITGTFGNVVINAQNGQLSLSAGNINVTY